MDDSWTVLEKLVKEVNRQTRQVQDMHEKARDMSASATSKDGMVTVTVGARGEVRKIDLDPRVYRKLSPSELSASLIEQIGAATRTVSGELQEAMQPFTPADLSLEDLFGEGADLPSFLAQVVTPRPTEREERP
ncbi:YbaB/EbfC family nucleoid-associated protein [Streptosporangium sp. NPDC051023]|uniref:YbaB/EbfC family nucleoid-associated protein n=1 Tax=Streptosporangium sp. NPDC051023 TaxID=3155410 RepID=UPI00344F27E8